MELCLNTMPWSCTLLYWYGGCPSARATRNESAVPSPHVGNPLERGTTASHCDRAEAPRTVPGPSSMRELLQTQ